MSSKKAKLLSILLRTPVNWNSIKMIAYFYFYFLELYLFITLYFLSSFIWFLFLSYNFSFPSERIQCYNIVVASWYLSLSTPKRNENTLLCLRFNYAHKLSLRNYNDQNAYNWSYFLLKCSNIERAQIHKHTQAQTYNVS